MASGTPRKRASQHARRQRSNKAQRDSKPRRGTSPLNATQRALGTLALRKRELESQHAALQRRALRESLMAAQTASRQARAAGRPILRILGEGDSWMHYDCGIGIMTDVQWSLGDRAVCLNLASSGDTMANMVKLPERAELDRQLRSGVDGAPWDVLLFSGGGNDVAGSEFVEWLLPYAGQKKPADAIAQPRFNALLSTLAMQYGGLAQRVRSYSPGTRVLINCYDFAIPDGRGVLFAGPWMAPGFTAQGYDATSLTFRAQVVQLLLMQFAAMLSDVNRVYPFMQPTPTQGLLTRSQWANELHPTNAGFRIIAAVFIKELDAMLRRRVNLLRRVNPARHAAL